jgi:endoglucanase
VKKFEGPAAMPGLRFLSGRTFFYFLAMISSLLSSSCHSSDPVSRHGHLQVQGNKIVDRPGLPVSLAGMSLFWGNVDWHGEKFWNADAVQFLKRDWNVSVVRAAMGVEDPGGYLEHRENNLKKVETIIEACLANGLYVIVDWHSHDAKPHQAEAEAFFADIALRYGKNDHIIYEIWNEPRHVTWAETIKPYSKAVIAAIRKFDPDNLIVVGSGDWSTEVDVATADPVEDTNVAYSFHFYAASHFEKKRLQAQKALDNGKALFVTEWGACESTGNGKIDVESTRTWLAWMKKRGISHCNWSICDKDESASALRPGVSPLGNWSEDDLTVSGLLMRKTVREWNSKDAPSKVRADLGLVPF